MSLERAAADLEQILSTTPKKPDCHLSPNWKCLLKEKDAFARMFQQSYNFFQPCKHLACSNRIDDELEEKMDNQKQSSNGNLEQSNDGIKLSSLSRSTVMIGGCRKSSREISPFDASANDESNQSRTKNSSNILNREAGHQAPKCIVNQRDKHVFPKDSTAEFKQRMDKLREIPSQMRELNDTNLIKIPKCPFLMEDRPLKGIKVRNISSVLHTEKEDDTLAMSSDDLPPDDLPDLISLSTLENFPLRSAQANLVQNCETKEKNILPRIEKVVPIELTALSGHFGNVLKRPNRDDSRFGSNVPIKNKNVSQSVICHSSNTNNVPRANSSKSCDSNNSDQFSNPSEVTFEFETCLFPESCKACSLTQDFKNSLSNFINESFFKNPSCTSSASIEEFTPMDPKKYKTELCRPYQVHGYCKYGFRCNYAHGLNQLNVSFRHGKYKTRNCESYHKTGSCRYGARCSFIHDPEEGIMKCAITDREVLEALHCHPSSSYIASITWRIVNPFYPPTELYFLTQPCEDQPHGSLISSVPTLTVSTMNVDDSSNVITTVITSYGHTQKAQTTTCSLAVPSTTSSEASFKEDDSISLHEASQVSKNIPQSSDTPFNPRITVSKDTTGSHSGQSTLKIDSSKFQKRYSPSVGSQGNGNRVVGCSYNKKGNRRSFAYCRDRENSYDPFSGYDCIGHPSSQGNSSGRYNAPNFRLDDFLRCLKTEGQHHLASWSPEKKLTRDSSKSSCVEENQRPLSKGPCSKSQNSKRMRDFAKYKTELCRSYQYNKYCEYGDNCLYAHGVGDLRSYPKHPMYRTKKCFSFHQRGFCLYGSRCQFLHNIE